MLNPLMHTYIILMSDCQVKLHSLVVLHILQSHWCRIYNVAEFHPHVSKTAWPNFKFFVHAACGHGSVLLWQCFNTLYTSGLTDDIVFLYHGTSSQNQARHYVYKSWPGGSTNLTSDN